MRDKKYVSLEVGSHEENYCKSITSCHGFLMKTKVVFDSIIKDHDKREREGNKNLFLWKTSDPYGSMHSNQI